MKTKLWLTFLISLLLSGALFGEGRFDVTLNYTLRSICSYERFSPLHYSDEVYHFSPIFRPINFGVYKTLTFNLLTIGLGGKYIFLNDVSALFPNFFAELNVGYFNLNLALGGGLFLKQEIETYRSNLAPASTEFFTAPLFIANISAAIKVTPWLHCGLRGQVLGSSTTNLLRTTHLFIAQTTHPPADIYLFARLTFEF